jgi:glycosyltransferase involved in cell wall biosynthesis
LRALRWGVAGGLRGILNRANSFTVLQTDDDRVRLEAERILTNGRSVVIRGSGVDVDYFRPLPEPGHGPIRIAVVARMLRLKGIGVLIDAFRLLRQRGTEVELMLAGDPDPGNPTSFSSLEMTDFARGEGISWLGHVEDVREVWRASHIAVLPSLAGEGISKALLEAAACGRPIVATDIPGAGAVVRAGRNGALVPPGDAAALAAQLAILIGDARLRRSYGEESRRIIESELSDDIIIRETLDLYDRLLGRTLPRAER